MKKTYERPAPPCGHPDHYYFADSKWPCPICAANRLKRKEAEDRNAFAEMVAEKVARKLASNT